VHGLLKLFGWCTKTKDYIYLYKNCCRASD